MSFFKDLFSPPGYQKSGLPNLLQNSAGHGTENMPVRMSLQERMLFRRELLFETVRASLGMRSIAPDTYRLKIMRTDKRGHSFVIMLDMSPAFMASSAGQQDQLKETAALIADNAQTKYGLSVGGVYWRADETLDASVASWARPSGPRLLEPLDSTREGLRMTNIKTYEQVSAQEMAEFEAAWQNETAVQIGGRTYSTDLAPLAEQPLK